MKAENEIYIVSDLGLRAEAVEKVILNYGIELNCDKRHQIFVVIQNLELKLEVLGNMVMMKTNNLNICSRLFQWTKFRWLIAPSNSRDHHQREDQGRLHTSEYQLEGTADIHQQRRELASYRTALLEGNSFWNLCLCVSN